MMTSSPQPTPELDEEISLVDIIRFFAGNWRLIGVLTLIFSGLGTAFALTRPSAYQRQITFFIQPITLPLSISSEREGSSNNRPIPEFTAAQVGELAQKSLEDLALDNATLQSSTYTHATSQLSATLSAPAPYPLETLTAAALIAPIKAAFETPLAGTLTQRLTSLEVLLDRHTTILTQLDSQLAQTTDTDTPRRQALERERATVLVTLANLTFDQQYLQQSQADLGNLTGQWVEITLIHDTGISTERADWLVTVLFILVGFTVAVLVVLIRAQIPAIQAELTANHHPTPKT